MLKGVIRQQMLQKRGALSKSVVVQKSQQIQDRLMILPHVMQAKTILFYVSYGNEVATHAVIKAFLEKKKTVVVPYTDVKHHRLILSRLSSWDVLTRGAYSILEPKKECIDEVSPKTLDVVIVPGVVFDTRGHRIGHGKGYYDGLLKNVKAAVKIGLTYDFQMVDEVPVEPHDIPVDFIVTETKVIECTR
jgi:5-formyltetrahydrofolate cyclo-ligase